MRGEAPEPLVTLCYSLATAVGLGPQLASPVLFCQYSTLTPQMPPNPQLYLIIFLLLDPSPSGLWF